MSLLPGQVELTCTAQVGGEEIVVRQLLASVVWDDPAAREAVKRHLRTSLMLAVLERWTPVVRVRR